MTDDKIFISTYEQVEEVIDELNELQEKIDSEAPVDNTEVLTELNTIKSTLETLYSSINNINTEVDNIYAKVDTEVAAVKTKTDTIGATGDTGGSSSAGTVFGKLNKIISDLATHIASWTSTRAGYVDNIRSYTITNNTASKTGVLSAKLAYVISLLENTTYGLSALQTASSGGLKSVTKTYNSTGVFDTGLTSAQFAGLYCVYIEGALYTSAGTKIADIADYGESTRFYTTNNGSIYPSAPKKFFVSTTYISGYSYVEAGVYITKNQVHPAAINNSGGHKFNGSITYYYF